ncbi:uncharacterized protein [Prorops nasuta]|uniref:uncharacterized protein isoform X2 n=1 Tax=Prorops nasuta TaxID=863751 RepID=UPI0034CFE3C5
MEASDLPETNGLNHLPILRRNHRIEEKWGLDYHYAVRDAVFCQKVLPYTPLEPTPALSEQIGESEPLYTCEECRDCFRFHSSFQEHINRHSWILGYWCQLCFLTVCKHVSLDKAICYSCMQRDSQKRAYLRSKGVKRGQKLGATKVFYNSCQFFAHLKLHCLNKVDMGDIMLMPFPNVQSEQFSEFNLLCEALMEHTFVLRVHLMDWLKAHKLEENWWKCLDEKSNDSHPIVRIFRQYEGRELFSVNSNINSKQTLASRMEMANSEETVLENEDNPCTTNDITFVDCGPTIPRYFTPEGVINPGATEKGINIQQGNTNDISKNEPVGTNTLNNESAKNRTVLSQGPEIQNLNSSNQKFDQLFYISQKKVNVVQPSSVSANTKILPKTGSVQVSQVLNIPKQTNLNIASILSKISPHLNKNKNIVIIGKDSEAISQRNVKPSSPNKVIQPQKHNTNKDFRMKIIPLKSSELFKTACSNVTSKNNKQLKTFGSKACVNKFKNFQNSEKSTSKNLLQAPKIKPTDIKIAKLPNKTLKPSNNVSHNAVALNAETTNNLLPNNSSILTPSPSPSERSNCSLETQDAQRKTPLKRKLQSKKTVSEIKDLFLSGSESIMVRKVQDLFHLTCKQRLTESVAKYRRGLIRDIATFRRSDQERQLQHLKEALIECSKFEENTKKAQGNSTLNSNVKNINIIIRALNSSLSQTNKVNCEEYYLSEEKVNWQSDLTQSASCLGCKKLKKPESYVPGVSKLSNDESNYCMCYNFFCTECFMYQTSEICFVTHKRYHKRIGPFICPSCLKIFQSFDHLQIHTWTVCFHIFKKRIFGCKICQFEGFMDIESIARHFAVMHSVRKIACENCLLVLDSYTEYKTHYGRNHGEQSKLSPLEFIMCKFSQCAVLPEKFMKHVQEHIGVRKLILISCPFCKYQVVNENMSTIEFVLHVYTKHSRQIQVNMKPIIFSRVTKIMRERLKTRLQRPKKTQIVMPKIVNTKTITREVFERASSSSNREDVETKGKKSNLYQPPKAIKVYSVSKLMPSVRDVPSENVLNPSDISHNEEVKVADKTQDYQVNKNICERVISSTSNSISVEAEGIAIEEIKSEDLSGTEDVSENIFEESVDTMPPPLAKIPQIRQIAKTLEINKNTMKPLCCKKKVQGRPWRIAFNGPSNINESQQYICHVCGDLISTSWSVIKDHFTSKHSRDYKLSIVTPRLLKLSSEFINGGYKELYGSRKRKSEPIGSSPKKKRRWTTRKNIDGKRSISPLGIVINPEGPEDKEADHRIKGRYLICLECGENFVVAPSLQMHLKAFHKIEDPTTYMSQNPLYAPGMMDDMEGAGKTTEPNQCYVCKAVFEDKAAVDKHLRVHGMAFLNRKRIEARKALTDLGKSVIPITEKSLAEIKEPISKKEGPVETIREKLNAIL